MDQLDMLNAFEHLLEDRATPGDPNVGDDFLRNNYEVVVAGSQVLRGTMYIALQANDGKVRHFRLTEV